MSDLTTPELRGDTEFRRMLTERLEVCKSERVRLAQAHRPARRRERPFGWNIPGHRNFDEDAYEGSVIGWFVNGGAFSPGDEW